MAFWFIVKALFSIALHFPFSNSLSLPSPIGSFYEDMTVCVISSGSGKIGLFSSLKILCVGSY
jgi:hypothetical protein